MPRDPTSILFKKHGQLFSNPSNKSNREGRGGKRKKKVRKRKGKGRRKLFLLMGNTDNNFVTEAHHPFYRLEWCRNGVSQEKEGKKSEKPPSQTTIGHTGHCEDLSFHSGPVDTGEMRRQRQGGPLGG